MRRITVTVLAGGLVVVGAACGSSAKGTPSGPGAGTPATTVSSGNGGGY